MNFRYAAELKDGARRAMRSLPGGVRKAEFRRNAQTPGGKGRIFRETPSIRPMCHISGCWKTIVAPELQEKASEASRAMALNAPKDRTRSDGGALTIRDKEKGGGRLPIMHSYST